MDISEAAKDQLPRTSIETATNGMRPDLATIAEQCDSSRTYTAGTAINDFGVRTLQRNRSSTDPSYGFGAPASVSQKGGNIERHPPQRSKTAGVHRPGSAWASFSGPKTTKSADSNFVPAKLGRNSTGYTNASLPFEETAIWDRKTILSLGIPYQSA